LNAFEFLYTSLSIVANDAKKRKLLLIRICILAPFILKRIHNSLFKDINGLKDSNIKKRFLMLAPLPIKILHPLLY
jgi:hypothetical protein